VIGAYGIDVQDVELSDQEIDRIFESRLLDQSFNTVDGLDPFTHDCLVRHSLGRNHHDCDYMD
jgi:hypothetical protein